MGTGGDPDTLSGTSQQFKEQGNTAFKNSDWSAAIDLYTKAIHNTKDSDDRELAVYYKNRAAARLKLEQYEEAAKDCDKSLEIVPRDPKALFRRSQALEQLGRFEEAYVDARMVLAEDASNKAVQPILERLYAIVQERQRQNAQVSTKVESMTKIAFDITADREKRETAINNFRVLARENAGSKMMLQTGIPGQIKRLMKMDKNSEIKICSIRIVSELCKHGPDACLKVLKELGIPWFIEILDSNLEAQVYAASYCLQTILNSFSGMENNSESRPKKELVENYKKEIDTMLTCLVCSINNRMISGIARDAIIELIMKNIHYTALSWAEQLVEAGGIERLMECASELEAYKYESAMNITPSTRTIAAVCMARIHENMYYDAAREAYMARIDAFIRDKLLQPETEAKVRAVAAITALLRGALEVGNALIGKEGIIEMILVMANSEDSIQQQVACECIVAAASKQDKAKAIIAQGMNILKNLYSVKNDDHIRVRALVGLCKLGSSSGTDATIKPLAEGSTLKLAEACRKFLLHPGKDGDVRKWAAEGLSYLTLDAEVKEKLLEDKAAIKALIEIGRTADQSSLYGCITTLVNLTNSYDKQDFVPEMVELAKYAKHHIPEEHEFDDPDFVARRITLLAEAGVTTALVALSKTESDNSRELIARVFNALCSEVGCRGVVVQQGGVKVLMGLSLQGTDKGKRQASQALARIAITMNPEVAFTGQRSLEVIRPLLNSLHPDCSGLENFEALMGLCNVAQMSESARQRIIKEGGVSKIDHYIYEDHEMLCRAATQCMTNMTMSPDVVKLYEGENDRLKFVVALMLDADVDTALAASGSVAILTGASEKCCSKIFESKSWLDGLKFLLSHEKLDLQFRGVCIARNLIQASKEVAGKMMETDIMEVLMAVTKLEDSSKKKVIDIAEECLKSAEEYGIIMKPQEIDPFVLAAQEREREGIEEEDD